MRNACMESDKKRNKSARGGDGWMVMLSADLLSLSKNTEQGNCDDETTQLREALKQMR